MARATAVELQRNFGKFQHKARKEPVEITRRGQRELVLMSAEHYDWLTAAVRRSFRTKDAGEFIIEAVRRSKMDPAHGISTSGESLRTKR